MVGDTWLDDLRRERELEALDAKRLADAMEAQNLAEFIVQYGPAFRAGGHGFIDERLTEAERVSVIIQRDRIDRIAESNRQRAELEVAEGVYVNLTEAVVLPTPEWLEKHETTRFVPKQHDDTVRVVATVRAVRTPIIARLWRAAKISDDIARACLWYRMRHERAGLEGRWSSSQWRGPDDISGGGSKGVSAGHMAMTALEAEARQEFRLAREALLPIHLRAFFDKVVLDDLPMRRAARFARCRDESALKKFRVVAESLLAFCEKSKIDLPPLTDLSQA